MQDFYQDTFHRMRNDDAFKATVRYLTHVAREHGFTPGELKQIAFRAALELEMSREATPIVFDEEEG